MKYSYPEWALRKLIKDYGTDVAEKIVSFVPDGKTSVRIADDKAKENFSVLIPTVFPDAFLTDGKLPVSDGTFTPQSLSSMAVARAVASASPAEVLDCCSAHGGKAVYVKQLCPNAHVVACDVHAHRVDLIRQYASRMGVQLDTFCADMTQYNAKWEKGFDAVLCDVPCSGFGVLDSRPDIKLFRENIDISNLMKLQYAILENCCNYVKVGEDLFIPRARCLTTKTDKIYANFEATLRIFSRNDRYSAVTANAGQKHLSIFTLQRRYAGIFPCGIGEKQLA